MKAHHIRTTMDGPPDFVEGDREAEFWAPQPFNDGMMWIGRFTGQSPWERHPGTDELLHLLEGEVELTVMEESGPTTHVIQAGSLFVVPRNRWHRLLAREQVTMCGVTPGPTDHSTADDPRGE